MLPFFLPTVALAAAVQPNFYVFAPFDSPEALAVEQPLPFPQWLTDFTGLTEWPGMDPPYIPLDFIDFSKIPEGLEAWKHNQGECVGLDSNEVCSFDCHNCVMSDDVHTCHSLSQTFDDGPSPFTTMLTSALPMPVTFFTIGINVVRFPQIYRETADKGHVMGSHTWLHTFLPSQTNEQIITQLEWLIWAMNATYGHLPKWFRPPYGGVDNRVRSILHQFGMQAVLWDFDTFDWRLASTNDDAGTAALYKSLESFKHSRNNKGLILEHDSMAFTVNAAIHLGGIIGPNQLTVSQCVNGISYIKLFEHQAD